MEKKKKKSGRPTLLTNGRLLYFWLEKDAIDALEALAYEQHINKSEMARIAIDDLLVKYGKVDKK